MMKSLVATAALLAFGCSAHAISYDIEWSGLTPNDNGDPSQAITLGIEFTGVDANSDGVIEVSELSYYSLGYAGGPNYIPTYSSGGVYHAVDSFAFNLSTFALVEIAENSYSQFGEMPSIFYVDEVGFHGNGDDDFVNYSFDAPGVVRTVTPVPNPVPEPSAAALALLGVVALGLRWRYRTNVAELPSAFAEMRNRRRLRRSAMHATGLAGCDKETGEVAESYSMVTLNCDGHPLLGHASARSEAAGAHAGQAGGRAADPRGVRGVAARII